MIPARNRFLVVVRAGDASLHPSWTEASRARSFDLVVSYFGRDPHRYRDAPFRRIDDVGQKYTGLKRLFDRDAFWRDYDFVWLPDDDLAIEQATIDDLFARMDALSFELAQPALDWHSHYSFSITLRSPAFSVRCTDMVEIMAPCFARSFLERCLPTFDANLSGWGLSFVWPHLLGTGVRRCGILDDVTVTHTRPVGGPAYDRLRAEGLDPRAEKSEILRRFGLSERPAAKVLAAIDRSGRILDLARRADAGRYERCIRRDAATYALDRARIVDGSLGRRPDSRPPPALAPTELRAIADRMPFST